MQSFSRPWFARRTLLEIAPTRPWARDLQGIGPNRYPLLGVIRLEFLSPPPALAFHPSESLAPPAMILSTCLLSLCPMTWPPAGGGGDTNISGMCSEHNVSGGELGDMLGQIATVDAALAG